VDQRLAVERLPPDGDPLVLVAQGASADFNPTVAGDRKIARAYEEDPSAAAAEYGGEFRTDIEAFVSREAVEACVVQGVREIPPAPGVQYCAFCDAAGGTGGDSFTLAISHREDDDVRVLDCLREVRPPFNPGEVIAEYARVLKSYRVSKVISDKYAGGFAPSDFAKHAVTCEQSAAPKSDLYRDALPVINTGKVRLLDNPRLVAQLCSLERRTGRGSGRDVIDHPPKGHDDVSNACAGALVLLGGTSSAYTEGLMGATSGVAALANEMAFYQRLGRPW